MDDKPNARYDGFTDAAVWAAQRDERIMEGARQVLRSGGLREFTREAVAEAAQVSVGTISNFGRVSIKQNGNPAKGYRERILCALADEAKKIGDEEVLGFCRAEGVI